MQNMAEYAVVAYKKGNNSERFIFNWNGKQNYIQGNYGKGMNVIENYERPRYKLVSNWRTLRLEEKSSELFMELLDRFTNPGDLVGDFFAGTASSAIAALKMSIKYIGCDKDKEVYTPAYERLLFKYQYLEQTNGLGTMGSSDSYNKEKQRENMIPTSNYPTDVIEMISEEMTQDQILKKLCKSGGYEVKKSNLNGENVGEGLFATKIFEAGEQIVSYYGLIINEKTKNERMNNDENIRIVEISSNIILKVIYVVKLFILIVQLIQYIN